MTREDRRAAILAAIGAGCEGWVARELAESLARFEYHEGYRTGRAAGYARGRIMGARSVAPTPIERTVQQ